MADPTKDFQERDPAGNVVLPSIIPFGFNFQQDTIPLSQIPVSLQKPESADLIKQKADADALAQPSTTQVAIGVNGMAPADKAKKKKPVAPVEQSPEVAAPAAAPAQGSQNPSSKPASTGADAKANTSDDRNPYGNSDTVVSDTPDTTDAINHSYDDERKNIHTLFQTLTGKDAIPYGEKWRWYLQHGFTGMHGGLHDELMRQVEAERKAAAVKNTYGQELRAQEMKRKTLMQQWDKLLWEWNHGYYSGDDLTVRKFHAQANRLRNAMIAEGISPDLIRDPSINAGGFAQGFQKDISQKRNDLDWLGGWMKTIENNIADDPNWLDSNQAQMEFDKMSEYVILKWAQSKGQIADADKIRAQVEAMPEEDRKYYNGFMSAFLRGNALLQMQSLAKQGNQHAKELVAEIHRLINYSPDEAKNIVDDDGYGTKTVQNEKKIMQLIELVRTDLAGNNLDLPTDLATALDSYKAGREVFDEYVLRNANVDRKMVWDSAVDQMNITADSYNRLIKRGGLYEGYTYDGYLPTKELSSKLAEWQANDRTDPVIRNASLTMPSMAGDTDDGLGGVDVLGGVGGATPTVEVPKKPKGLEKKNAWAVNGVWYYSDKGKIKKWSGK